MRPALLSQEQIQAEILEVTPHPYFERLIDHPGTLVLRAKGPRGNYRGIHIALSTSRRKELEDNVRQLRSGMPAEITLGASLPDGRAWFNLFTSGINFGNWMFLSITRDNSIRDGDVWTRFVPSSTIHLRMNSDSLSLFASSLENSPFGGKHLELNLMRDQKPLSEPHNLWFWQWRENADG
jgi:hypothetical protein